MDGGEKPVLNIFSTVFYVKYHMTYVSHMVWYKATLPYYHPNLHSLHELDNQPLSVMNLIS